jgi:hypothetical protein
MSKGYSGNPGKEGRAVIANCLFEHLCFFSARCIFFQQKFSTFEKSENWKRKEKRGGKKEKKEKKAGAGYK